MGNVAWYNYVFKWEAEKSFQSQTPEKILVISEKSALSLEKHLQFLTNCAFFLQT